MSEQATNPIYAGHHFHHVARVSAYTNGSAVLTILLHGHEGHGLNEGEVKVFLEDEALVDRLVKAINNAAETVDG